jgi:serine/threonine-protein kinase HipA
VSSSRLLQVRIGAHEVGTLFETNGLWSFQYSEPWLDERHAFALSPHLPLQSAPLVDGGSVRYVQWYFDNLLPEESQRLLLASDAKLSSADAFGLLAYYGSESAGSLTLLEAEATFPEQFNADQRLLLEDSRLSERIKDLPSLPLTHGSPKRMSLAGAQHKLAVILDHDDLYEPVGAAPSTHILKPDHERRDLYPHSAVNEWFVMRLASSVGMLVPSVCRRYVPEAVYLVARFDRRIDAGQWQRLHVVDACQLTGLDRTFKYSEGSLAKLVQLLGYCRSAASARTRLYAWLIFNVLVGNNDAHLKNLSFLVDDRGIDLAPHYDLLSSAVYESPVYGGKLWPHDSTLAWPILGQSHFADINRATLLDAGLALGLQMPTAKRMLEKMLSQIVVKAQELYDETASYNIQLAQERPELGATLAGEARCLRAIIHNVIKPMAGQLG